MAITPDQISKVIATEDDFGHEMRAGRFLRGYLGSQTLQGGTYSDPISGKARQFDFRWRYMLNDFVLRLAVECKNVNADSPIIISGCKRTDGEAFHDLVESRKGGSFQTDRDPMFLDVSAARAIRRVTGNHSVYSPEAFVGKSLLQLKKERGKYIRTRDAEIYDKWSQALASGVDLVHEAGLHAALTSYRHMFTLVLPVVVVPNDTLWKVEYDINGRIVGSPQTADECEFYVGRSVSVPAEPGDSTKPYTFSHLHFLTLTGFGTFLLRITKDEEWLKWAFYEQRIAGAKAERLT